MTECNDTLEFKNSNNLTTINPFPSISTIQSGVAATDSFAYSPTIQIYQLDKLQSNFEKSIVFIPLTDTFITSYGQAVFDQSLISFNNFLLAAVNTNTYLNLEINYPLVYDRTSKGVAITALEFSAFMTDCGYNPISIQEQQTLFPKTVLSLYDSHINGKFTQSTMGAFCSLAPVIFGAVAGFFTVIKTLANKITDIINTIQNFSLATLIDQLKKKITDVIEKTIAKVKQIIENFTLKGLISQTQQFFHNQIMYRFKELKDQAMSFFEAFNLENFKKRIDGLISYATGLFKNPKLEEIQFLIYRFCSFISQVENIINGIKNPLEAFTNSYISGSQILKARSDLNTLSAVAAGAKRFNGDEVYSTVGAGVNGEITAGNSAPPSQEEVEGVTSWNNGDGDGRLTFSGGARSRGSESWTRITPEVRVLSMRLQQQFGRQLNLISGWRSTETQRQIIQEAVDKGKYSSFEAAIASGKYARPGNSQHEKGTALDITWSGFDSSSTAQFISIARSVGFTGIGWKLYAGQNFVHIDKGSRTAEW